MIYTRHPCSYGDPVSDFARALFEDAMALPYVSEETLSEATGAPLTVFEPHLGELVAAWYLRRSDAYFCRSMGEWAKGVPGDENANRLFRTLQAAPAGTWFTYAKDQAVTGGADHELAPAFQQLIDVGYLLALSSVPGTLAWARNDPCPWPTLRDQVAKLRKEGRIYDEH